MTPDGSCFMSITLKDRNFPYIDPNADLNKQNKLLIAKRDPHFQGKE